MNKDDKVALERASKYDAHANIRFRCLTGKTDATLSAYIEPDPHGDETGTHGHFHTTVTCPNTMIVDFPEPDRCQITNESCPFTIALGSRERNPESRKLGYAHDVIQNMAFIELYGSQLVNELLKSKGLKIKQGDLRRSELARTMVISNLIDKETYKKLNSLRGIRNKFAHDPKIHLKHTEKELFEWSMESRKLSDAVRKLLEKYEEKEKREETLRSNIGR